MTITPNDNRWSGESRYGQDVTGGLGDGMRDINAAQKAALLKTERASVPTVSGGGDFRMFAIDDDDNYYAYKLGGSGNSLIKFSAFGGVVWEVAFTTRDFVDGVIDKSSAPNELAILSIGTTPNRNAVGKYNISTGAFIGQVTEDTEPNLLFPTLRAITHDVHNNRYYILGQTFEPFPVPSVRIFSSSISFVASFGSRGSGDGEFLNPFDVAVSREDEDSVVYVADTANDRVQSFSLAGSFQSKVDDRVLPAGVCVDSNADAIVLELTDPGPGPTGPKLTAFTSDFDFIGSRSVRKVLATGIRPEANDIGSILYHWRASLGVDHIAFICSRYDLQQTEFSKYTTTVKTSLGTPDGGASVPAVDALDSGAADVVPNHIIDMRDAIEILSIDYAPSDSSAHYNWIDLDALNLYLAALGDRTTGDQDMGFSSPSPAYDWERTQARMEASDVVVGSDGNDYVCIMAHTATNDNRPVTGIDIVVGTDGNDYRVIAGHTSTDDNKPITGPDYEDVWEATGGTGEGAAWGLGVDYVTYAKFWRDTGATGAGAVWIIGTLYTTNQTYDIDIAEVQLCAAKLVTPYTFGET